MAFLPRTFVAFAGAFFARLMANAAFTAWAQSFSAGLEREVIAIDGKTVRGSFDRARGQSALHIVSAWACERGLSLGQVQVSVKSNEHRNP